MAGKTNPSHHEMRKTALEYAEWKGWTPMLCDMPNRMLYFRGGGLNRGISYEIAKRELREESRANGKRR